jgi:anti-sigma B factor antagonist
MQASEDFSVDVHRQGGAAVVAPVGEIDVATVDAVRDRLRECETGVSTLVLDLRGVGFMDTSGLQLVFEAQRRAAEAGFEFFVVRGSRQLHRLFQIAGLEQTLQLLDDPADAA